MGRIRAALRSSLQRTYWRDRRSGSIGVPASRTGSSFPLVKPTHLWKCARLFLRLMAYATINTGGRQFRVADGDTIDVDLLDVESGKTATFGEGLMFSDGTAVT